MRLCFQKCVMLLYLVSVSKVLNLILVYMETVGCRKQYQESLFINMHNIFKTINTT